MFFPFVILAHSGWASNERGDHWDWLLDWPDGSRDSPVFSSNFPNDAISKGLIAFASNRNPCLGWIGLSFRRLPLHRKAYLTYEGPVSGDRGEVRRVASGQLDWLAIEPHALQFRIVKLDLEGAPSKAWPSAPYCLTHCGEPQTARRPWYDIDPDPSPFWQLQRKS